LQRNGSQHPEIANHGQVVGIRKDYRLQSGEVFGDGKNYYLKVKPLGSDQEIRVLVPSRKWPDVEGEVAGYETKPVVVRYADSRKEEAKETWPKDYVMTYSDLESAEIIRMVSAQAVETSAIQGEPDFGCVQCELELEPVNEKPVKAEAMSGNSCQNWIDAAKELVAAGYSPTQALKVLFLAGGQQHAAA
jgi:hypothetical protein